MFDPPPSPFSFLYQPPALPRFPFLICFHFTIVSSSSLPLSFSLSFARALVCVCVCVCVASLTVKRFILTSFVLLQLGLEAVAVL